MLEQKQPIPDQAPTAEAQQGRFRRAITVAHAAIMRALSDMGEGAVITAYAIARKDDTTVE